jgi:hypothetical protein
MAAAKTAINAGKGYAMPGRKKVAAKAKLREAES